MQDYLTVPGAQITRAEREFIKQYAELTESRFDNPVIANIGVLWGATMWCIRRGAPDATLYGVDIKLDEGIHRRNDLNAHFIEGDSTEIWKQFNRPIHLLLVDGDHNYETVKRDIAGWVPKVAAGGIIIFHDYAPTDLNLRQFPHIAGVRRAVDEWFNSTHQNEWLNQILIDSIAWFRRRV